MSIENPISNEELEKAYAINSLVDAKILNRKSASEFNAEEVDRFAGYFQALREAPEIKMKEGRFEERDGYPSDVCYVIARYGDQTEVSQVRILEHFQGEDVWENRLKKAGDKNKITSPHNDAITYKPGLEKKFEASIRGPLTVEEAMAEVEKTKVSLIEIELKDGANHITVMKAIAQVAEDYKQNFEKYQRERMVEAEQVKRFAIDLMRQNKSVDPKEAVRNIQGLVLKEGQEHGLHYVAAINSLIFAIESSWVERIGHSSYREDMKKKLYEAFGHLISIFGPKDSLRQIEAYNASLRQNGGPMFQNLKAEMPDGILFQGCRIAEVGGNYVRKFEDQGAEAIYTKRYFDTHEHGGIKTEESQITLDNYEQHYPGQFDITMSRQVMEFGSGVGTGFQNNDDEAGSRDLLAAFANMTRKGGISIHNGNKVPTDEKYLQALGLELIFTIKPENSEPAYVFVKIDDRKVTKKDIAEARVN